MAITIADVHHIASLARLGIGEERAALIASELNTILAHMDALSAVDTHGIPEAMGAGTQMLPLRADSGPAIPLARPLEDFAPSVRDGLFLVPRLSSHESTE